MTTNPTPEGAQDEALRLAHALDGGKLIDDSTEWADALHASAAALRRLCARVQEQQAELQEQARLLGISAERELRLQARVQELERERDKYKLSHDTWHEKTEWVQATSQPRELGMHRADVLRQRIMELESHIFAECVAGGSAHGLQPIRARGAQGESNNAT